MNGKLHFLNTGHSDCIILESRGHFAMIDAAEDTAYPADKPHLKVKGYEDLVVEYLLANCTGADGRVHLDFVLATHAHSDHMGGFDTVIDHPLVDVETAYLKPYQEKSIFILERARWDNREVYTEMRDALRRKNVEVIEQMDGVRFPLGDLTVSFYNGNWRPRKLRFGENINSVVTLVEAGGTRAVLAGDLNNKDGDECRLAPKLGKVDLLKVGHHGYVGSTSWRWAKTLSPRYAVVTNTGRAIYPDVRFKLRHVAKADIYATQDLDGVVAELYDRGEIKIRTGIMGGTRSPAGIARVQSEK